MAASIIGCMSLQYLDVDAGVDALEAAPGNRIPWPSRKLVDFRRQYEIAFGQAVDLVG